MEGSEFMRGGVTKNASPPAPSRRKRGRKRRKGRAGEKEGLAKPGWV